MSNLRIPPHSLEAEQSILAAIMVSQKGDALVGNVFDLIKSEMFYSRNHQIIFNAMVELGQTSELDLITVNEKLEEREENEQVGGLSYLGDLTKSFISKSVVMSHCNIVIERYKKREILATLNSAEEQIYSNSDTQDTLSFIDRNVSEMDLGGSYEPLHIRTKITDWIDVMEQRVKGDQDALGYKTGIKTLDDQIVGIKQNWLVVLAGRPSMGKTIIAQLINSHISKTLPTMFFSMEMSGDEIMERYIGLLAGISTKSLKTGALSEYEWERTHRVLGAMKDNRLKIHYDETPGLALNQIRYRVKSTIKKVGKLGLVTIDYLDLMTKQKAERDDLAIGEITRGLKQLAKETNTPILLLVQANRGTDQVKRPTMSNLYGSSKIEADADLILFAHRDEVNNPTTAYQGVVEVIPTKFRHGDCHLTSYLQRNEEFGKFECLTPAQAGALEQQELSKKADEEKRSKPSAYQPRYAKKNAA